jgi:D-alanine-D-alanine ligase
MKIGLTYDLRSEYLAQGYGLEETAEFDRVDTIDALQGALTRLGHEVVRIGNVRALVARLAAGLRCDLVFNIAEGMHGFGREAQVPALLDAFGIPYTFSDPLVSCITLHKATTKHLLRARGIPTPAYAVVERPTDIDGIDLPFPLFVKPIAEGTSKGCDPRSLVRSRRTLGIMCRELLDRFRQPVLVETFLPGREVTVGILGTGEAARAIAALEVMLLDSAESDVYSYANKENSEELVEYRLVRDSLGAEAHRLALASWRAVGARDAGRVDLRCNAAGALEVIEINSLPGLHPEHSDLPMLCSFAGMSYDELIAGIVESAAGRVQSMAAHHAA